MEEMKLTSYDCRDFALRFETERKNFNQKRFFSDPRLSDFLSSWLAGESLYLTHYTNNPKASDYHAHLRLVLRKESVRTEILWFRGTLRKRKGSHSPFAEDILKWIGGFYTRSSYNIRISVNYSFPHAAARLMPFIGIPFGIPFSLGYGGGGPIKLIGVTVATDLPGALRARVHSEVMMDGSLWVMIQASYKSGLLSLGPDRLLPEFGGVLAKYLFMR